MGIVLLVARGLMAGFGFGLDLVWFWIWFGLVFVWFWFGFGLLSGLHYEFLKLS